MSIKIELTKAEALVLHDLLDRISKNSDYYEDISEQYVLWNIECQLDKKVEPVDDYTESIKQARDTVRKNY